MRMIVRQWILITVTFVTTCQIATAQLINDMDVTAKGGQQSCVPFRVFDGTMYSQKPDLTRHGIESIPIVYAQNLWPKKIISQTLPPRRFVQNTIRSLLARNTSDIVVLDVEQWRLETQANARENIPKYQALAQWVKEANRSIQVGYFGMFPLPDYQRGSKTLGERHYKSWQLENARLKDLGSAVDILFPEAYTPPWLDREEWVAYAQSVIKEARSFGKPVYVFLWPQFYEIGPPEKTWRYIPTSYWDLQLRTARQFADGLVIWGGYDWKKRDLAPWDDDAAWWQVTKAFMEELRSC